MLQFDLDAVPIISIAISAPRDLREITHLADKLIKQNLETVSDVGAIHLVGARARAVQVAVDIDRLWRAG